MSGAMVKSNGASKGAAAPNIWTVMNYPVPRGKCVHKPSLLAPGCPCLRFMLNPLQAASSFACDGCGHHASFHNLRNPGEEDADLAEAREMVAANNRNNGGGGILNGTGGVTPRAAITNGSTAAGRKRALPAITSGAGAGAGARKRDIVDLDRDGNAGEEDWRADGLDGAVAKRSRT